MVYKGVLVKNCFADRIIINKNINTAIYVMILQQVGICLRRSEPTLTNAL